MPSRCFPVPFPIAFWQLLPGAKRLFPAPGIGNSVYREQKPAILLPVYGFFRYREQKDQYLLPAAGNNGCLGHRRRAATKRGGYNTAGCGGLRGGPSSPAGCCLVREPGLQGQSFQLGVAPSGGAEWPEVGHSRRRIRFCRNIRETVAVLPGIYYLCPTSLNTVVLRVHKAS